MDFFAFSGFWFGLRLAGMTLVIFGCFSGYG